MGGSTFQGSDGRAPVLLASRQETLDRWTHDSNYWADYALQLARQFCNDMEFVAGLILLASE